MPEYNFSIRTTDLNKLTSDSRENIRVPTARILNGKFIDIFEKAILENEPTVKPRPRIIPTNNQFYPNAKKLSTSFLRITAKCSHCKKNEKNDPNAGKYLITINRKPTDEEEFARVKIQYNEHDHNASVSSSSVQAPSVPLTSASSASSSDHGYSPYSPPETN
jgi:hypothetical protein